MIEPTVEQVVDFINDHCEESWFVAELVELDSWRPCLACEVLPYGHPDRCCELDSETVLPMARKYGPDVVWMLWGDGLIDLEGGRLVLANSLGGAA